MIVLLSGDIRIGNDLPPLFDLLMNWHIFSSNIDSASFFITIKASAFSFGPIPVRAGKTAIE